MRAIAFFLALVLLPRLALAGAEQAWSLLDGVGSESASVPHTGTGRVLRVGPRRDLRKPSDAARIAQPGDTIEIDAGIYFNDSAYWRANGIILRGVGGMAHLHSQGLIPNGKAIWVISGDNVRVENIEFSGAAVHDTNGAGIRHEGGNLVLVNTFFHDNEFSLLSGELPHAAIEIHNSRFWHHKRPVRHSHGIYIGKAGSLLLTGSHFTGTDKGHHVKSRALINVVAYNRIEDVYQATTSRAIDLPNCGFSLVIGNQIHQAASVQNFNAIAYGAEGCSGREREFSNLYVSHNTYINDAERGPFVHNFTDTRVRISNNLIYGDTRLLLGPGAGQSNIQLPLEQLPRRRWEMTQQYPVRDFPIRFSPGNAPLLLPLWEFTWPLGVKPRPYDGIPDAGAVEFR